MNFQHVSQFLFLLAFAHIAWASPQVTTYQARIIKPDGYPLEASNVNFKFSILNPAGNCILFSETYASVSLIGSGGLIAFPLGSGVKSFPASSTTFADVFNNSVASLACEAGGPNPDYQPDAFDNRKIVMQFNDGTGWQTLPAMSINAVPYAIYATDAMRLGGVSATSFVQYSTIPTCAASESLSYSGTSFSCVAVGGAPVNVTSGTVVAALGYTPADDASVTAVSSTLTSVSSYAAAVSSTVYSVSSTVSSLENSVSSLQSSVAASLAAIVSSQWTTSGTTINYTDGNVGIGTGSPVTKLDVSGGVRISMETATCAVSYAGTLRYNAGNVEFCNGTTWTAFGVATAGLNSFNGSTSQTQTFANGTTGNAPAFVTANGVHTLNIPFASATGSVTAGLISNVDYVNFSNKITSSAAAIAQVLGYAPASATALGNYLVKANNLSDLTSSATARTNLGLGAFATMSSLDLGSASASGTLAAARLPAFAGDVSSTAGSNSLIVAALRGIAVSTTAPVSGQILTYNGSTWAPMAAGNSSQWTTSGTAISYSTGNVGIGTSTPATALDVSGTATFRQAYFERVGALGTLTCGTTNITGYSTNLYTLTACSGGTTILNIPTVTGWPSGSMSWTVTFFVTAQTASTFNVRYNNATTNVFWDKNSTGGAGGVNYSGFLINDTTTNVFTCTVINAGSVAVYCGVSAQY